MVKFEILLLDLAELCLFLSLFQLSSLEFLLILLNLFLFLREGLLLNASSLELVVVGHDTCPLLLELLADQILFIQIELLLLELAGLSAKLLSIDLCPLLIELRRLNSGLLSGFFIRLQLRLDKDASLLLHKRDSHI